MSEKINPNKSGLALAIVFGIISLVCALFVAISPDFSIVFLGKIFHGIDLSKIAIRPDLVSLIIGVIEAVVLGFASGWLFGYIYNKLNQ